MHRWWPFVLLVLAGASRWIVAAAHPETNPTVASETVGCIWAACVSFAWYLRQPVRNTPRTRSPAPGTIRALLTGAMLFGGPAVALLLRGRELDTGSLTIALALTPIVIAIAASALGASPSEGIAGRIWPGLAAVAGLLLLLAQPTLGDARSDIALLLAPALTGMGAALFCANPTSSQRKIPLALLGGSTLFAVALAAGFFLAGARPSLSLLAIACDGVVALLGVLTLAQLGAARWSSQFTWIPLLIVIEGLVLVHAQLTAHWIVGLALLALASVYLLLPDPDEPSPDPSTVLS